MDERIKILIEKRKKLGWTVKHLAEKAGLSHGEALHVEKKGIYNHTYVSKLEKALEKGIREYIDSGLINNLEKAQNGKNKYKNDRKKVLAILKETEKRKSILNKKWSRKYDECINCGSTEKKHYARGLCQTCYNRNMEMRTIYHERKSGVAGKKLIKEYLFKEYIVKERSLNDIAKECMCSRQYVYKLMKHHNIPRRNKSLARSLALEKKKLKYKTTDENGVESITYLQKTELDENFFSNWSMKMAYVLGFIFSDGNIGKHFGSHHLTVSQKEPEILYKLLKLMNCDVKLLKIKRKKYKTGISGDSYFFRITNEKIFNDLVLLGLTPDKSLTIDFPIIPHEYVRHFIRGCWDGDGSVYIEKKNGSIRASYTSGSINFIKGMLDELEKAGLKKRKIYTVKRKKPTYYFRFTGVSQCKKLYHYLYDNVSSDQFLQRKFDVLNDFLN